MLPEHWGHGRAVRMRRTIRIVMAHGLIRPGEKTGVQIKLATHFKVTRQRIYQLVKEIERGGDALAQEDASYTTEHNASREDTG